MPQDELQTYQADIVIYGGTAAAVIAAVQARRMGKSWVWQQRSDYGNRDQGTPAMDGQERTMWIFEPHAAEGVFMEPVFMILGQSAATAAALSIDQGCAVQDIDGERLRQRLVADDQRL